MQALFATYVPDSGKATQPAWRYTGISSGMLSIYDTDMLLRDTYRVKALLGSVQHSSDKLVAAVRTVIYSMWSEVMVGVNILGASFGWRENCGLFFSRGVTAGTGCLCLQDARQGEFEGKW